MGTDMAPIPSAARHTRMNGTVPSMPIQPSNDVQGPDIPEGTPEHPETRSEPTITRSARRAYRRRKHVAWLIVTGQIEPKGTTR